MDNNGRKESIWNVGLQKNIQSESDRNENPWILIGLEREGRNAKCRREMINYDRHILRNGELVQGIIEEELELGWARGSPRLQNKLKRLKKGEGIETYIHWAYAKKGRNVEDQLALPWLVGSVLCLVWVNWLFSFDMIKFDTSPCSIPPLLPAKY